MVVELNLINNTLLLVVVVHLLPKCKNNVSQKKLNIMEKPRKLSPVSIFSEMYISFMETS